MIKILNVKTNNNSPDYAVHIVDETIKECKLTGLDVIIVIHGYGSHGKGGIIKQSVIQFLDSQKKFKKILDYIPGECFSTMNEVATKMRELYPQLLLNSQLYGYNSGVTVVWVQNKQIMA